MSKIIRSQERFFADHGWLKTYHSFSFNHYYDPANVHFGTLRVVNEDVIEPGEGFGLHPHRDMEILTYVLAGALKHQDSMGNEGILQAGEVQTMTAGSGVYHAEFNASDVEPVHLLQIWFMTQEKNLTPAWQQRTFAPAQKRNQWVTMVSGDVTDTKTLHLHQDLCVSAGYFDASLSITKQFEHPLAYLFLIEGRIEWRGEQLQAGDTVRIDDVREIQFETVEDAHVLLMTFTDQL